MFKKSASDKSRATRKKFLMFFDRMEPEQKVKTLAYMTGLITSKIASDVYGEANGKTAAGR